MHQSLNDSQIEFSNEIFEPLSFGILLTLMSSQGLNDQPFCAPSFLRAHRGRITGPANCILHQSKRRLSAKYKIQLAVYKIQ